MLAAMGFVECGCNALIVPAEAQYAKYGKDTFLLLDGHRELYAGELIQLGDFWLNTNTNEWKEHTRRESSAVDGHYGKNGSHFPHSRKVYL